MELNAMAAHASGIDELIPHMKRAGFIMTGLAALITASFGWSLGESYVASFSLAGMLALCTFIVGYALVAAYHAFKLGMYWPGGAAVAVFTIAVVCEFVAHTGFNAAHRDATVQNANHQTASYEDTRGTIKQLSLQVDTLQEKVRMAPKRTAEGAEAAIQNAKANRFWEATNGCKETKGPQTRRFCDAYFSAVADKSGSTEILTVREELKQAQDKLAAAKGSAAKTGAGHANAASQNLVLASMVSLSEKPDESSVYWAGIGLSALLAIFAISGGLINFIAYAFDSGSRALAGSGATSPREPFAPSAAAPMQPMGYGVDRLQTIVKQVGGSVSGRDFYGRPVSRTVQAHA
jgi:hypothetical protein